MHLGARMTTDFFSPTKKCGHLRSGWLRLHDVEHERSRVKLGIFRGSPLDHHRSHFKVTHDCDKKLLLAQVSYTASSIRSGVCVPDAVCRCACSRRPTVASVPRIKTVKHESDPHVLRAEGRQSSTDENRLDHHLRRSSRHQRLARTRSWRTGKGARLAQYIWWAYPPPFSVRLVQAKIFSLSLVSPPVFWDRSRLQCKDASRSDL